MSALTFLYMVIGTVRHLRFTVVYSRAHVFRSKLTG